MCHVQIPPPGGSGVAQAYRTTSNFLKHTGPVALLAFPHAFVSAGSSYKSSGSLITRTSCTLPVLQPSV